MISIGKVTPTETATEHHNSLEGSSASMSQSSALLAKEGIKQEPPMTKGSLSSDLKDITARFASVYAQAPLLPRPLPLGYKEKLHGMENKYDPSIDNEEKIQATSGLDYLFISYPQLRKEVTALAPGVSKKDDNHLKRGTEYAMLKRIRLLYLKAVEFGNAHKYTLQVKKKELNRFKNLSSLLTFGSCVVLYMFGESNSHAIFVCAVLGVFISLLNSYMQSEKLEEQVMGHKAAVRNFKDIAKSIYLKFSASSLDQAALLDAPFHGYKPLFDELNQSGLANRILNYFMGGHKRTDQARSFVEKAKKRCDALNELSKALNADQGEGRILNKSNRDFLKSFIIDNLPEDARQRLDLFYTLAMHCKEELDLEELIRQILVQASVESIEENKTNDGTSDDTEPVTNLINMLIQDITSNMPQALNRVIRLSLELDSTASHETHQDSLEDLKDKLTHKLNESDLADIFGKKEKYELALSLCGLPSLLQQVMSVDVRLDSSFDKARDAPKWVASLAVNPLNEALIDERMYSVTTVTSTPLKNDVHTDNTKARSVFREKVRPLLRQLICFSLELQNFKKNLQKFEGKIDELHDIVDALIAEADAEDANHVKDLIKIMVSTLEMILPPSYRRAMQACVSIYREVGKGESRTDAGAAVVNMVLPGDRNDNKWIENLKEVLRNDKEKEK